MKRFCFAVFFLACFGTAAGLERAASIEGITEHRVATGLRVLRLPDPGVDTIIVHVTYLVGSRHEGYGEKGMAHLLEHMLFKGSKRFPNIKEQFSQRGARWNGTTASDRTTSFHTFPPPTANLQRAPPPQAHPM